MLKIRLRRQGAKRQPFYRIVVAEAEFKRDGRFVDIIGQYNPRTEPAFFKVDEARALHFLSNGAQPSDAVRRILTWSGTMERMERLKKGEATIEALVAEAEEAYSKRQWNLQTRRDDLTEDRIAKKQAAKAAKAAAAQGAAQE